jgi:hypothetical protein
VLGFTTALKVFFQHSLPHRAKVSGKFSAWVTEKRYYEGYAERPEKLLK